MALLNNIFEFPSDAFKIVTHFRHPLPQRTDTIGPWLDCLSFLAWLSALTNSALIYLFRPQGTATTTSTTRTSAAAATVPAAGHVEIQRANMQEVLARTLFIALAASHGFILLRAVVRHVLERVMWYGSEEKKRLDTAAREVKEQYVQSIQRRGSTSSGGTPPLGLGTTPRMKVWTRSGRVSRIHDSWYYYGARRYMIWPCLSSFYSLVLFLLCRRILPTVYLT